MLVYITPHFALPTACILCCIEYQREKYSGRVLGVHAAILGRREPSGRYSRCRGALHVVTRRHDGTELRFF